MGCAHERKRRFTQCTTPCRGDQVNYKRKYPLQKNPGGWRDYFHFGVWQIRNIVFCLIDKTCSKTSFRLRRLLISAESRSIFIPVGFFLDLPDRVAPGVQDEPPAAAAHPVEQPADTASPSNCFFLLFLFSLLTFWHFVEILDWEKFPCNEFLKVLNYAQAKHNKLYTCICGCGFIERTLGSEI